LGGTKTTLLGFNLKKEAMVLPPRDRKEKVRNPRQNPFALEPPRSCNTSDSTVRDRKDEPGIGDEGPDGRNKGCL